MNLDSMGWPIRMAVITEGGVTKECRVCARPTCTRGEQYQASAEFRIDGYCSCECRDEHELESELEFTKTSLQLARNALEHIYKGAGPYNRDPLRHAENCILDMKMSALEALTELRKRAKANGEKMAEHSRSGNCWDDVPVRDGNIVDFCEEHDEPRGSCSVCPKCPTCGME